MSQPDTRRYFKHGTLPQLRLFEAIARLGTFVRAAQELHMAQPTASLQIKKLTATVGAPLFQQVGKRVHLTEAGRRLQESCRHLFVVFDELEASISVMRRPDSGRMRLAVSTTGMSFASRLLDAFVRGHPGVEISMQAHDRLALVQRLANNEDDLYLFTSAPQIEGVITQEIDPFVVRARVDHARAASDIAFERLAQEPLENRWYFAYTQRGQLSPVARALLEFAHAEAKKQVAEKPMTASAPHGRAEARGRAFTRL